MKRGALIVLEGVDRSGKTTQCSRLLNRLVSNGISCELMRFPDRTTPIGKMIDGYLQSKIEMDDHALHLLFSANRWEAKDSMLKKLNSGVSLIVDRYSDSGVVFSAAKGLDVEWCKKPDVGLPNPDAVIFLTLPIEIAMKRGDFGKERYEKEEMQRKVSDLFLNTVKQPWWKIIDASPTQDEVEETIFKEVYGIIQHVKNENPSISFI